MATEYDMIIINSNVKIIETNPRSRTGRKKIIGKTTPYGKPEDPDYFKKYYETKYKTPIECTICGCFVTKYAMFKHTFTKYCRDTKILKEKENNIAN